MKEKTSSFWCENAIKFGARTLIYWQNFCAKTGKSFKSHYFEMLLIRTKYKVRLLFFMCTLFWYKKKISWRWQNFWCYNIMPFSHQLNSFSHYFSAKTTPFFRTIFCLNHEPPLSWGRFFKTINSKFIAINYLLNIIIFLCYNFIR